MNCSEARGEGGNQNLFSSLLQQSLELETEAQNRSTKLSVASNLLVIWIWCLWYVNWKWEKSVSPTAEGRADGVEGHATL